MTGRDRAQRKERDERRSPRRSDYAARDAAFRAWVARQGADLITVADVKARLAITTNRACSKLGELVAEGVLVKVDKGEWRLKGSAP